MNEDLKGVKTKEYREPQCIPAQFIKFIAEIVVVISVIAGLCTIEMSAITGVGYIIGGIVSAVLLWILSLIVRCCYKYLRLN